MFTKALILTLTACLVGKISAKTATDNLLGVVQTFRHGQRTPTWFYANDPYSDASFWPAAEGQLTNEGKQQHYALGEFTVNRYKGFISSPYDPSKFYIQTTDMDRTHMSAQCNVAAIFPPKSHEVWNNKLSWQPIPIHPIDASIFSGMPTCALFYKELGQVISNPTTYLSTSLNYTELFEFLTEQTGSTISTIMTAQSVYDALFIEELNGYTLPDWTASVYPEPLKTVAGLGFLSFGYSDNQKRLIAGSWLNTVIANFEELWEDPTVNPGYQIYSGHDSNIATILNTLEAFTPHCPAYASSLYFELRNISGEAIVNIWHKNLEEFEQITVRGCTLDCPLATFKELLSPWLVDATTWSELCSSTSSEFTSVSYTEELSEAEAELVAGEIAHKAAKYTGKGHAKH